MYRGKHELPRKRGGKLKKSGSLIASLLLLLTLTVGGSIAFLIDTTAALRNTFVPTSVNVTVVEDFKNNVKSSVTVENTSDIPVYVRATLAVYWTDSNGVIVEPETCEHSPIVINDKWVTIGDIYYYPTALGVGGVTENLLHKDHPIYVTIMPEGVEYRLVVEVLTESIQAEPATAVQQAWGVTMPMTGGAG